MIVPMYKYSFLVFHSNYKDFLKDIREIGVVHIEVKNHETTQELQEIFRQQTEVEKAINKLESLEPAETDIKPDFESGKAVFDRLKDIEREAEYNHHQELQLEKEKKQMLPWGDFDWSVIEKLEDKGIQIRFMSCPVQKFSPAWEEEYYIRVVGDMNGYCYFVKLEKNGNGESENEFEELSGADELLLPERSLSQIKAEIKRLNNKKEALRKELRQIAFHCKPLLQKYYEEIQQQLTEQNALLQTTEEVEGKVKLLEGWVPETKKEQLEDYLEKNKILYTSKKPDDEDKVPILLKNNRFARLYEIIGSLYELPNYKELDLVPFFAPFYMMFFGFALGDAGYGLFIIALAEVFKRKKPEWRSVMSLAQWLGFATVIFGIFTGTFFGIDLINAEIPWLESFKAYMIDTDQLFDLAIIFGVIQIIFGLVLKVINTSRVRGFLYSFSTIGWLIVIFGMGAVYGLQSNEMISPKTASIAQTIVLISGGVFILLLNNPKRNILMNIGVGIWDVYIMLTGLLGDILSYIRLFALGVSSAILGLVFNSMALSMKPDNMILGPLVMIIILIFGHSITIFMAGIGAFVHPIRLTFVEFYKNAGFTGGGKPYNPFAEPASKVSE